MLVNMLKAVSNMLEYKTPNTATEEQTERPFAVKVSCAKVVLDEIIRSLESGENPKPVSKEKTTASDLEPKAKPEPKASVEPMYQIMVDDNQMLIGIKNLPLDAEIEVDGKVMKHSEALGKKFTKGKIL